MTSFFALKEQFLLEGVMPERALLRLKRAKIPVYNVKKIKKNQILFCVNTKDSEKVFAIYANVWYNNSVYSAYTVKKLGAVGAMKWFDWLKRRVGLLLGGLLCVFVIGGSQTFVFSIECKGAQIYAREVKMTLEEAGITPLSPYKEGKEDWICARLLALDGVEFCSVKKDGYRVVVEMQTSPFPKPNIQTQTMQAKRSGKIIAMTVLRGTPLKKIGDEVRAGETLVENWFETEKGEHVRVEIIARVRMACVWEARVDAQSEEEAFAKAYLLLELSDFEEIKSVEIMQSEDAYLVKIDYETVEKINF